MWSADQGDGKERFLADLRALRDTAALGYDELAARAHYPSDVLKEAENGPSLPSLPILAAYVRACDGDVPDWEERWRGLGFAAPVDPGLPVRPAGASPAAVAGARAGINISAPDVYDPERIRAALRGQRGHADQVARATANQGATGLGRADTDVAGVGRQAPGLAEGPAGWDAGAGWGETAYGDTAAGTETAARTETAAGWGANASRPASPTPDGGPTRDATPSRDATPTRDTGPSRDAGTGWNAGTNWDGGPRRGTGTSWDGAAEQSGTLANGNHHAGQGGGWFDAAVPKKPDRAGSPEAIRHDPFSAAWLQDHDPASAPTEPDRESARRREDGGLASPEPTDLRTPPAAAAAPADVRRPEPPPLPTEEQATPLASRPLPAEPSSSATPPPAQRMAPELPRRAAADLPRGSGSVAAAQSQKPAEPAVPQQATAPRSESRKDRLYPVRLLVVVVVAALIGSILVMVIR
jgi:hypothetical protein